MGKNIKAIELKDVRIDFVSLVDRGANGFPFKFVKSEHPIIDFRKNVRTEDKKISKEEVGFFKKLARFFKKHEEEKTMDEKILKSLDGLTDKIDSIEKKIEKIQKEEDLEQEKDTNNDAGEGTNTEEGDAGDNNDTQGEGQSDESSHQDVDKPDNSEEVEKALKTIIDKMDGVSKRVEALENIRKDSKSIKDEQERQETEKAIFKGIF